MRVGSLLKGPIASGLLYRKAELTMHDHALLRNPAVRAGVSPDILSPGHAGNGVGS